MHGLRALMHDRFLYLYEIPDVRTRTNISARPQARKRPDSRFRMQPARSRHAMRAHGNVFIHAYIVQHAASLNRASRTDASLAQKVESEVFRAAGPLGDLGRLESGHPHRIGVVSPEVGFCQ